MVVADVSARQTGPLPKAPQHLSKPHPRGEVRVQARVVPAESKENEGAHCFSREFQRKCRSHTDTIRGLVDAPSVYAKGMREGGGAGVPALRRASPPRHRPAWEADTLPAELLPLGRHGLEAPCPRMLAPRRLRFQPPQAGRELGAPPLASPFRSEHPAQPGTCLRTAAIRASDPPSVVITRIGVSRLQERASQGRGEPTVDRHPDVSSDGADSNRRTEVR